MKDEDEIPIPKELEDEEILPPVKDEKPKEAEKPKEIKKFRSLNNLP